MSHDWDFELMVANVTWKYGWALDFRMRVDDAICYAARQHPNAHTLWRLGALDIKTLVAAVSSGIGEQRGNPLGDCEVVVMVLKKMGCANGQ